MTQDYPKPIAPPPELVRQWLADFYGPATMPGLAPGEMALHLADVAARWGADQELEACCEYLTRCAAWEPEDVQEMCNLRRPKPPSLKEQAQRILVENGTTLDGRMELDLDDISTLRRALEQLDD